MSNAEQLIESTLRVTTGDESTAVQIAEILARVLGSLSAEGVTASLEVDRFEQHCHHPEHGEEVTP